MKKTALTLAAVLLAFILGMPVHANASWSVFWNENGIWGTPAKQYKLTKYEVFILSDPSGTQLESLSTSKKYWESTIVNPTYGFMSGPAAASLSFSTIFSGAAHNGLVLDFVAWVDNTIVGAESIVLSGAKSSKYTYQELDIKDSSVLATINSFNRNPVPLPNAAWLFGAGLIGLISARRRLLV